LIYEAFSSFYAELARQIKAHSAFFSQCFPKAKSLSLFIFQSSRCHLLLTKINKFSYLTEDIHGLVSFLKFFLKFLYAYIQPVQS